MKSMSTQIKEHASKEFGFQYSRVVPLECSTVNGWVTSYTFSVNGREYAAEVGSDMLAAVTLDSGSRDTAFVATREMLEKWG